VNVIYRPFFKVQVEHCVAGAHLYFVCPFWHEPTTRHEVSDFQTDVTTVSREQGISVLFRDPLGAAIHSGLEQRRKRPEQLGAFADARRTRTDRIVWPIGIARVVEQLREQFIEAR
jgi:hypothetical protein